MSLKNIVFCRKITFIRIKEMRIILSYEEMSLFNIMCLWLNFIFLLREFWNDIIKKNKTKTMDDIMFMIMQNFYKKWTRIAYCPWIGALSKH